jgi:aldose 1-epimerase
LENDEQTTLAEIWPSLGSNCLRWRVASPRGPLDLLYVADDWEQNPIPTRSGIPVLFPFPNRIRNGHFVWEGKEYQLPLNSPEKIHAIHGFACRSVWRVLSSGADASSAWITTCFQPSVDRPDMLTLWPADYRISITFRMETQRLSILAAVENPTIQTLPWGLGYHPYFRTDADSCLVQASAQSFWTLKQSLPTGEHQSVLGGMDLRSPRPVIDLKLDDVLTNLDTATTDSNLGILRGQVIYPAHGTLRLWTDSAFRELVVFTPPHRKAICLEPYTCTTDAVNLAAEGIDAGWQVLSPGAKINLKVILDFEPGHET